MIFYAFVVAYPLIGLYPLERVDRALAVVKSKIVCSHAVGSQASMQAQGTQEGRQAGSCISCPARPAITRLSLCHGLLYGYAVPCTQHWALVSEAATLYFHGSHFIMLRSVCLEAHYDHPCIIYHIAAHCRRRRRRRRCCMHSFKSGP